jgi:hypothetical protein
MDDFLLCLVNDGNVFLMNVFLIDDRLDVLMDHILMVLMDDIFVSFLNYVLVMLMDYVPMRFFDDRSLDSSLNYGSTLMLENLALSLVGSEHRLLLMPDHSRSLTELFSSYSINLNCVHSLHWSCLDKFCLLNKIRCLLKASVNKSCSQWCTFNMDLPS